MKEITLEMETDLYIKVQVAATSENMSIDEWLNKVLAAHLQQS